MFLCPNHNSPKAGSDLHMWVLNFRPFYASWRNETWIVFDVTCLKYAVQTDFPFGQTSSIKYKAFWHVHTVFHIYNYFITLLKIPLEHNSRSSVSCQPVKSPNWLIIWDIVPPLFPLHQVFIQLGSTYIFLTNWTGYLNSWNSAELKV